MSIQLASAQRKTVIVETPTNQIQDEGMVLKRKVAIGRFSNETQYAKGIFYDKENDPMGKQALDILSTKILQKSGIQKNEVIELIYRGFI